MKIAGKIIIVLLIALPIVICCKALQSVWKEDEFAYSGDVDTENISGDLQQIENLIHKEEEKQTASNLGDGVEYDVTGIMPISKVYSNAEVSISLANVYSDHDETSEVLGKLEKGSLITVQKYDNGWSTVTNYSLSGWMKTENIKLPETDSSMTIVTNNNTKTGTVKVNDVLNLRASASTSATILKSLPNGTVVKILETTDKWYKVEVDGVTGWVSSDYVTVK